MLKKILLPLLCILMSFGFLNPVYAADKLKDDQQYRLVNIAEDGTLTIIKEYADYAEAKVSHTLLQNRYRNLGITYGTSFLTIEYGIVAFNKAKSCDVNINYINAENEQEGYTNGCYGADGAFLEHNLADGRVKFMLSGVVGWVNDEDVTIYPIEMVKKGSSYKIQEGILYHNIQTDIQADAYNNQIMLSKVPPYLYEDATYYSYDNHYFYSSYQTMIDDYQQNKRTHALNAKQPFYNYFQYISHRTTSQYTLDDLQRYFKDTLAINHTLSSFYDKDNYIHDILTQSLLPDALPSFLQYQNMYGSNALLMLSLSMNETAMGKSLLAYTRNNLFGHAAFDSAVEENASRYRSLDASVYSHALHYISKSYTNPDQFQYHGSYLGDKRSGMNVQYASDPYWGEKAAQYAFKMDLALGEKDYNQYCIGITNRNAISVYQKASTKSKQLYKTAKGSYTSLIILEKTTNKEGSWYMIQSDIALDDKAKRVTDGSYSYTNSYGYIKADTIDTLINSQKIDVKNYIPITFDANGGSFYPDQKQLTLQIEQGILPTVTIPQKDHALFMKWDRDISIVDQRMTYKAIYKDVLDITLSQKPQSDYALHDLLDVSNGKILVNFKDGTHQELDMTSEMISGFDANKKGKQTLTVTYAGTSVPYEIHISKEREEKNKQLASSAQEIIKQYADKEVLNKEAKDQLDVFRSDQIGANINAFTQQQIRLLDNIFQKHLHPSYSVIIKDKTYDLAISGLSLALQENTNLLNKFMPKTIVLQLKRSISKQDLALVQKVVQADKMRLVDTFSISGKDDFKGLQANSEMIFSIKKPADHKNRQFSVYYIEGDDVYQLPTTQTENRIVFTSEKIGSYAIVSQTNSKLKEGEDVQEVNRIADNGFNYILYFIVLPIVFILLIGVVFLYIRLFMRKKKIKLKRPFTKQNKK